MNNFEGAARAKKKPRFLVNIFHKVPENAFFDLLFEKFTCGPDHFLTKWGPYNIFGELRKMKLFGLKKDR